jgi:hypothetical protein
MKFYMVRWRSEDCPEGTAGNYFTSRKEAEKFKKELDDMDKRESVVCDNCGEMTDDRQFCPDCRIYSGLNSGNDNEAEIEVLEFHGTAKQIAFKCLQHQTVPS